MRYGQPLIGVTTKEIFDGNRTFDTTPLYGQSRYYCDGLSQAGAASLLIPMYDPGFGDPIQQVDTILDHLDGLVVGGGTDINPELYGESPHADQEFLSSLHDQRDQLLIGRAQQRGMPMLLICRGMQMWNILNKGSLHQHLPELTDIDHLNHGKNQVDDRLHAVMIDPKSSLGSSLTPSMYDYTISVDSHHHQAIKQLGTNLRAIAWAPDGVIEAIQSDITTSFALGLQWHAETTVYDHPNPAVRNRPDYVNAVSLSKNIFSGLVSEAKVYAGQKNKLDNIKVAVRT